MGNKEEQNKSISHLFKTTKVFTCKENPNVEAYVELNLGDKEGLLKYNTQSAIINGVEVISSGYNLLTEMKDSTILEQIFECNGDYYYKQVD